MRNKFATDLRQWRGVKTQSLAANALDVTVATYRNWEQGRNTPAPLVQMSIYKTLKNSSATPAGKERRAGE